MIRAATSLPSLAVVLAAALVAGCAATPSRVDPLEPEAVEPRRDPVAVRPRNRCREYSTWRNWKTGFF